MRYYVLVRCFTEQSDILLLKFLNSSSASPEYISERTLSLTAPPLEQNGRHFADDVHFQMHFVE